MTPEPLRDEEPDGNRLDNDVVVLADRRGQERPEDKFGRAFDPVSLQTCEECRQAIVEIDVNIANLSGALSPYEGTDRDDLSDAMLSWVIRARTALFHRRRIRKAIGRRYGDLSGSAKFVGEAELEAMRQRRQEMDHELKMERIEAANGRERRIQTAFKCLVKEILGSKQTIELLQRAQETE